MDRDRRPVDASFFLYFKNSGTSCTLNCTSCLRTLADACRSPVKPSRSWPLAEQELAGYRRTTKICMQMMRRPAATSKQARLHPCLQRHTIQIHVTMPSLIGLPSHRPPRSPCVTVCCWPTRAQPACYCAAASRARKQGTGTPSARPLCQ
jgi:hypothetical protein